MFACSFLFAFSLCFAPCLVEVGWFVDAWFVDAWFVDAWFVDAFVDAWFVDAWFVMLCSLKLGWLVGLSVGLVWFGWLVLGWLGEWICWLVSGFVGWLFFFWLGCLLCSG